MANLITIQNEEALVDLLNMTDGDMAYCEDENTYKIYRDDEWQPFELDQSPQEISVNLYELNKTAYKQLPAKEITPKLKNKLNNLIQISDYWLLYGREIGYFTLFSRNEENSETFDQVIFDCLDNIASEIKEIEFLDNNSVEIWIQLKDSDKVTVLYLFNYAEGIVYYG